MQFTKSFLRCQVADIQIIKIVKIYPIDYLETTNIAKTNFAKMQRFELYVFPDFFYNLTAETTVF
jgi:hypothetical protein